MREIHLDRIDSTQTYAKQRASMWPKDEVVCISAEEQMAGRGRYQRKWLSSYGENLLVTFFFRLPISTPLLISLSQLMAYSLAKVLLQEGFTPQIKWPNDLLLCGKKVSGILCETAFGKESVDIFLGVGVNINLTETKEIDQPATSLKLETGCDWDKKEILHKLQKQFLDDLKVFKKEGFAPFHLLLESLLAFKGEEIRLFDGKREWVGICHSLTLEGQLNLLLPEGKIITLSSGDINASFG